MITNYQLHKGRSFGGIAILWHKSIAQMCNILKFDDPTRMGVEVAMP